MRLQDWVRIGLAAGFSVASFYLSYIFFNYGVALVNAARVVAGLVAVAIGFALLSAAVTLLRDAILVARASERRSST